jgi:naphthoate synthase
VFGQTGPKVGSFDAGYGSTQMVRLVGQKKAREIWFLARLYNAQQVRFLKQVGRQSVLLRCEKVT